MVRVNHAGEYGAQRIYQGQIDGAGAGADLEVLRHMQAQEDEHLAYFSEAMTERGVRPTVLLPLWHALGYALGWGTARLSNEAAMACTVAVEEVIHGHYDDQLRHLEGRGEGPLMASIERFQAEEWEHREIGMAHSAEEAPGFPLLLGWIKSWTRWAIGVSRRF